MAAPLSAPELYSLRDIAAAAGVSESVVLHLAARGSLSTVAGLDDAAPLETLVAEPAAAEAVRTLAAGGTLGGSTRAALAVVPTLSRPAGLPMLAATGLHAVVGLVALGIASLGLSLRAAPPAMEAIAREPVRLVYLADPGPGGGGGGGGLQQPLPPAKAQRQGTHSLSSPLAARDLPPPAPPRREPPRPLDATPLPPVMAPIASAPSDSRDVAGVLSNTAATSPALGPGAGGGAGTGRGTGLGEGRGPGVGDGTGGGIGGGPYRAGSGIDPPRLLREVKATYTEEARRANITGDVELEITIRRDGTVSDVRVRRGLGGGLDERAVAAVRQWRFAPAQLKGQPVDVIVEVSVQFALR